MAKRQRDPAKEAYWRKVLKRFSANGLSVREFCQREQLMESAFYAWRRTIGQRDSERNSGPAFVPAFVSRASTDDTSIAVELVGGCVLRFSGSMATKQLADLIFALQSKAAR
jgi:hypothetical protein